MSKGYTSYKLSEDAINFLREIVPPRYPNLPGSPHITYEYGVSDTSIIPEAQEIKILGITDDNNGVQAFVVSIDDNEFKPDGNRFHISWSYDNSKIAPAAFDKNPDPDKRTAKPYRTQHSNGAIRELGFKPFEDPIIITDFKTAFTEVIPNKKKQAKADFQNGSTDSNTDMDNKENHRENHVNETENGENTSKWRPRPL